MRLQLHDVEIQANGFAFAAVRGDGSVVTWGGADVGCNSRAARAPHSGHGGGIRRDPEWRLGDLVFLRAVATATRCKLNCLACSTSRLRSKALPTERVSGRVSLKGGSWQLVEGSKEGS